MENSNLTVKPKDVVSSLLEFQGRETREIKERGTGLTVRKVYLKYKCLKPGCINPQVIFQDKTDFRNPYHHLRSCYTKGELPEKQDELPADMHIKERNEMESRGGTICSHFNVNTLSQSEQCMYGHIRWVLMGSRPISEIEDHEYRRQSKYVVHFKKETVQDVMFKLAELVEARIRTEMANTLGAPMFDGWSCAGTHYTGLFASYCASICERNQANDCTLSTPKLTLIALSPMGWVWNDGEGNESEDETAKLYAEVHQKICDEVLSLYGQKLNQWCTCLIADNTNLNCKIARLCGVPHIWCNSYKLNLEVNSMMNRHADLKSTISCIHDLMRAAKSGLKNAALLRNLTELRPVLNNETRWSGKFLMLQRFTKIRNELIDVSNNEDGSIPINVSIPFSNKVAKYAEILGEMDVVTRQLQKKGYTLADCRQDLDTLIEAVEQDKTKHGSRLHNCRLGTTCISPQSSIVDNVDFETAVAKIQKGNLSDLSTVEKSCARILAVDASVSEVHHGEGAVLSMKERLFKRRRIESATNYGDCRYVLGSVAEVERLWSTCGYILTQNRRSMTPQLFETLVFLKLNERFWDVAFVAEAMSSAKGERAKQRSDAHSRHPEIHIEIDIGVIHH